MGFCRPGVVHTSVSRIDKNLHESLNNISVEPNWLSEPPSRHQDHTAIAQIEETSDNDGSNFCRDLPMDGSDSLDLAAVHPSGSLQMRLQDVVQRN